jgi:hypothetical protein
MRILVSCLQSEKRHPIPAYDFWRRYFVEGLNAAGHQALEVPDVDWAEGLTYAPGAALEAWRARTWERVLGWVRREMQRRPIDFFLGYLFPLQVDGVAIRELQRLGIPCVNFFCDNVREFRKVPQEFFPFALHWVPEFEALPIYRNAGLPHIQAAYPCWVPVEFRTVPTAETEPPSFIGSADRLRRALLGRAIELGGELRLYGPGWQSSADDASDPRPSRTLREWIRDQVASINNDGGGVLFLKFHDRLWPVRAPLIPEGLVKEAVWGSEYFRVSREASVTIGVSRVPTTRASHRRPLRYSRLRDVEAPMLGACYLTEWTESIGQLYEIGAEVETYHTSEELAAKLAELIRAPERRRRMRERAQRRALGEHAVGRSITRIAARLGISPMA